MTTETVTVSPPHGRVFMFFTALGMSVVPFMFLWAIFRVITGSAFWRRAFKYWFVMLGVLIVLDLVLVALASVPS